MKGFPTRTPADLEDRPRHQQWLVDGLWGRHAVGIVGGEPKCGKSFLALDLAVAVAAGVPCLRNFAAERPGPVLLFAAEDAGHIVRTRLQGIARAADADFESPGLTAGVQGRLRRRLRPQYRGARRHAECGSLPPRPPTHCNTKRARLRSHRAGLRPAPRNR